MFQKKFADSPETFLEADPFHHVGPGAPPILLIHGMRDLLVPIAQSRAFAEKLRAAGASEVHLCEVPHALHAFEVFPTPLYQRAVRDEPHGRWSAAARCLSDHTPHRGQAASARSTRLPFFVGDGPPAAATATAAPRCCR